MNAKRIRNHLAGSQHWRATKLRHCATINPSKAEIVGTPRETPASFLPMEAIGDDGRLNLEQSRPVGSLETGYTYFREGDVTIAKITPCFENGKGAIMRGLVNGLGFGTTELIVVRPDTEQTSSEFLNWIFLSSAFRQHGEGAMYGAGGQKRLPDEFVRNFRLTLPPLAEQQTIAAFLDRETAKIDRLVAEQRRLIELLKEKRQAVISHAVTKGLNPDVRMKPSGIEWVGDVPEHWEVLKLKRVFASTDYGISDSLEPEGNVLVLRMGNIRDGIVDLSDLKYVDNVDSNLFLEDGDLLYNRTNSLELVGKVGLFHKRNTSSVSFASYLVRLRIKKSCEPSFFSYLLNCPGLLGCARSMAFVAIGQSNLNPTKYAMICVAIPPLHEQSSISRYLTSFAAKTTQLVQGAERAITLLQERRTALISAAVTGKIDVRGWNGDGESDA